MITDAQILELRATAGALGDTYTVDQTFEALGEWGVFCAHQIPASVAARNAAESKARAWCASVIQHRTGGRS